MAEQNIFRKATNALGLTYQYHNANELYWGLEEQHPELIKFNENTIDDMNAWNVEYFNKDLVNPKAFYDKKEMLDIVSEYHFMIKHVPEDLLVDKDFIHKAVWIHNVYEILDHTSLEIKNDKQFFLDVIQNERKIYDFDKKLNFDESLPTDFHPDILQHAGNDLLSNREFILEVHKDSEYALSYMNDNLKNDKELFMEAMKTQSNTIQFAGDDLRNDKEFMIEVLKKEYWNMKYASDELKNNQDFVREAIEINPSSFQWASEEIKDNFSFVSRVIDHDYTELNYSIFRYATERVQEEIRSEAQYVHFTESQNLHKYGTATPSPEHVKYYEDLEIRQEKVWDLEREDYDQETIEQLVPSIEYRSNEYFIEKAKAEALHEKLDKQLPNIEPHDFNIPAIERNESMAHKRKLKI